MITELLLTAGALYLLNRRAKGIGKVERIKRRIYKEVSLAQDAGVDFSKKYADLSKAELDALEHIGKDIVMWKQSKRAIENGKPYTESYYGSLRRAWNAVSGISGIGRAYDVKDANGNVVLTWNDVTEHIEQEPEAKVLLALPPHIEPKKTKAKRKSKAETKAAVKEQEYNERRLFAEQYINTWLNEHENSWLSRSDEKYNIDSIMPTLGASMREIIINEFANGTLKWRHDKQWKSSYAIEFYTETERKRKKTERERDNKGWIAAGTDDNGVGNLVYDLIEAWNNRYITEGFAREDLDDIRRALLDRAKHMHVDVPYEKRDDYRDLIENNYIRGDNRYKALELINWIWFVHQQYERGGDTYYPRYSFDTKEDALIQSGGKMKGNGFKIIPVWEVPIEQITGILMTKMQNHLHISK